MVKTNFKIVFFILFFIQKSNFINAQKLFIPINDSEIISLYKLGEKEKDGSYTSKDSLGNIRVQGQFNKLTPVGK